MHFKFDWNKVGSTFVGTIPLLCLFVFGGAVLADLHKEVRIEENMPHTTISYEYLFHGQIPALKAAVNTWNTKLGWRYFRLEESGGNIRTITTQDPKIFNTSFKIGVYSGRLGQGVLFILPSLPDGPILRSLFCHELGHALDVTYFDNDQDLDPHTDNEYSVMNPNVDDDIRPTPNPEDVSRAKQKIVENN